MNHKTLIVLALIAILSGASVATVYLFEASINYSLEVYSYQNINNQWYTIDNQNNTISPESFTSVYAQNTGTFDGSFDIIMKLTNATFSKNSFQLSQFIDNNTVKLSFTLRTSEKTYTDVPFTVNNNVTQFLISLSFQTNQLFINHKEANWGGQSVFSYDYWENNTWLPIQIA